MATTASLRVVKEFVYRGSVKQFSNRYHFTDNAPSDNTKWTTFSDAIVNAEKPIYMPYASGGAKIVEAVGYDAGSEVPVFTKTYSTDGTAAFAPYYFTPGDVAALLRYSTSGRSAKNHPIYLFNYYHAVGYAGTNATKDTLLAAQKTAMGTYAAAWITGFSDGTTTHHRAGPNGDVATGYLISDNLTHRDFPRG